MEELALALSRGLNALGLLAAPRAWAQASERVGEEELGRGVREGLAEALQAARAASLELEFVTGLLERDRLVEALSELVAALEPWSGGPPPTAALGLARASLAALGVPEPEAGWEAFGPDEV